MKKYGLLSVLLLTACGTVFSGTTQDISIDSNIRDVSVFIDGAFVCSTPCVFPAERASGSIAIVGKKMGYKDIGISLKSQINPVAIGNLFFVYSWTTDLIDGAAWKYRQDGVYLNMEPIRYNYYSEQQKFKSDSQIRRFSLFNYPQLKIEASAGISGEYIKSLSALTNMPNQVLITKINSADNEVSLAHSLVK